MSTPTQGPWFAIKNDTWGWCVQSTTANSRRLDGSSEPKYVASRLRSGEDARLIAAAQEQHAALLTAPTPNPLAPFHFVEVYEKWFYGERAAAIAKVEG